ncbi:MAG: thioredoxin fold domain-containing protein [Desulfobacterales bacterium]|nr:thioredoxin fold domain-containing protein [Desulfobacterales bacterium]MBF0397758.1 thioredoxin fold domain-containing protein [Desulfobacterales bacterium]
MKKYVLIIVTISIIKLLLINVYAYEDQTIESPSKGIVTMIDLGAKKCIPCKMMAPIIEELKKEYQGKASIIFIDVWENREEASKYKINAIPTQIFFDKDGKEVNRHIGFMDKKSIINVLEKLGVN